MSSPGAGAYGQAVPENGNSPFNQAEFHIRQLMATIRTATIVQVTAVTSAGEVAEAKLVDVKPLVKMVDGIGNTFAGGPMYDLPFFRLFGGTNGIICDPVVGDIGLAVFCDRDTSSVKATRAEAQPGSYRKHDVADGFYLGGWPAAAPTQYVRFFADGMTLADKNGNTILMNADGVIINGMKFTRDQKISQFVEATANGGHTLTQHTHTDPQGGAVGTPTG